MTSDFLPKLSLDYGQLLMDTNYHDVLIEVGHQPHVKTFKTHSLILRVRCPFFAAALSSVWVKRDQDMMVIKKPNMSPIIFDVILNGKINIRGWKGSEIMELLYAADELALEELADYVQDYLCRQEQWILQNIFQVLHISFGHASFQKLKKNCIELVVDNPLLLFDSEQFAQTNEEILMTLLKRDDLVMKEIAIWEGLIQWGIAQTQMSEEKFTQWSKKHFSALGKTLKKFLPTIRFFQISSEDIYRKVLPYRQMLPHQLVEELVNYHRTGLKAGVLPKRIKVDSSIISTKHAIQISYWIDYNRDTQSVYKFKLLFRASRDGFHFTDFHLKCNNQDDVVLVMKVEDNQIFGGYNPVGWCGSGQNLRATPDSFIFFFDKQLRNPLISRVAVESMAIKSASSCGPCFGVNDLAFNDSERPNLCYASKKYYDKRISEKESFEVKDYEILK
ncbi:5496_t:CDS:2, partial [Acaulospora colombiana]